MNPTMEVGTRLDQFMTVYAVELERCVREFPDLYAYPVSAVPGVLLRMKKALMAKSYNLERGRGSALAAACRKLGLPVTQKALNAYLTQDAQHVSPGLGAVVQAHGERTAFVGELDRPDGYNGHRVVTFIVQEPSGQLLEVDPTGFHQTASDTFRVTPEGLRWRSELRP